MRYHSTSPNITQYHPISPKHDARAPKTTIEEKATPISNQTTGEMHINDPGAVPVTRPPPYGHHPWGHTAAIRCMAESKFASGIRPSFPPSFQRKPSISRVFKA